MMQQAVYSPNMLNILIYNMKGTMMGLLCSWYVLVLVSKHLSYGIYCVSLKVTEQCTEESFEMIPATAAPLPIRV